ncbi:MAG: hypothetical protein JFR41_01415 [Muribaculaceae bacterium]|nr:hypothetical protein [Muribaculaceae bacterium]
MNPKLKAICEKYNYNIPSVIDALINRYIKEILEDLSATVPSLAVKVPTKLTMKQKNNEASGKLIVERNAKGEVVMPRYNFVTTHTARRSGIVPVAQIRHRPDDARQRSQNPKDFYGLHQTLLRGDSRRNRRPNKERR